MKRLSVAVLLALGVCLAAGPAIRADVKTQEKSLVKFEGMLGRMVNMFGGKAAKEGVVSNIAVQGDRKSSLTDNGGQIIDLGEEKIYELDARHKTYKVTTFEEIRRQIREARENAAKQAKEGKSEPAEQGKEVEIDFTVKETGQKKDIAGYNTHEVVAILTVREKGKTLEQSGGLVMTSNLWLAPTIAAMKEIQNFDVRYAKAIDVTGAAGVSAEQLASALAMYPGLQKGLARMQAEGAKMEGTPLETVLTVEAVKSPEQMEQAKEQDASSGGGGLGGMLARKMMKKKDEPASPKSTVMTITHDVLSIATSVNANDLQVPADFKQKS